MKTWNFYLPRESQYSLPRCDGKQTILAIGNVQSGKTRFMAETAKWALTEGGYDFAIVLTGNTNLLSDQSFYRFSGDFNDSNILVHDIKSSPITKKSPNTKYLITALKHQNSLQKIIDTIIEFPKSKFIIFDDESDFGSINISSYGESVIFKLVKSIFEVVKNGTFVSVTATPFADLLSDSSHQFDYIKRLKPADGYTGLNVFNNSDAYVKIPNSEKIRNGNDQGFLVNLVLDHVSRVLASGVDKSQLLINTDLDRSKHNKFFNFFSQILDLLIEKPFVYRANKELEKFDLMQVQSLLKTLRENLRTLNLDNTEWDKDSHSVIIGGSLISRGYTFENLITALMLNVPEKTISCDTLLQRARWFGYRKNIEFIKVYLSERTVEAYLEAEKLNDILFSEQSSEEMRESFSKIKLEFVQPTGKVKTWNQ